MTELTTTPPTAPINLTPGGSSIDVSLSYGTPNAPVSLVSGVSAPATTLTHGSGSNDTYIGPDAYTHPFHDALDGGTYYASWQHLDGQRWKAQRTDCETLVVDAVFGLNPQPSDLTEFQALSW